MFIRPTGFLLSVALCASCSSESPEETISPTLSEYTQYASTMLEDPPLLPNDDLLNPDYSHYRQSLKPNQVKAYFRELFIALGFSDAPVWTPETFADLLKTAKEKRLSNLLSLIIQKMSEDDLSNLLVSFLRKVDKNTSKTLLASLLKEQSTDSKLRLESVFLQEMDEARRSLEISAFLRDIPMTNRLELLTSFLSTSDEGVLFTFLSSLSNGEENGQSLRHVVALRAPAKTRFIIFGNLYGAFHSLLRNLNELKVRGIIDDNFKLLAKDTYIVFNGNQIDRSAYSLETLSVILSMLNANDGKVFYTSGKHEHAETWQDYNTGREITNRFALCAVLFGSCEIRDRLTRFFETLPESLYILDSSPESASNPNLQHAIKIVAREEEAPGVTNAQILKSAIEGTGPVTVFIDEAGGQRNSRLVIDAVVRTIERSIYYRKLDGLDQKAQERGAIAWTTFSAPTTVYQRLFDFSNDAFVELMVNKSTKESTISLNKQTIERGGYKKTHFHLLSGEVLEDTQLVAPPYRENYSIPFGSLFDLSGPSAILGLRLMNGVDLRFRKQNKTFQKEKNYVGIGNQLLRLYMIDDRSSTSKALQNVETLKKDHGVDTFIMPEGIETTEALLPQIRNKEIKVFFPNSGSGSIRQPELTSLINLRTSYANEACALVEYSVEELHKKKYAIFFQNDGFGRETLEVSKRLLRQKYRLPKENICEIPYKADSLDMTKQAAQIAECIPEAIIFLSTFAAAEALVQAMDFSFLAKRTILGLSATTDALRNYPGLQVVISRVVPNPLAKNPPLVVQRYKEMMDEQYKGAKHNPDSLEAYIATSLTIRTMEEILRDDPPVTAEKLMKYIEAKTEHQDIALEFNPQTRELINTVWLDTGDDEWIEKTPANQLCL